MASLFDEAHFARKVVFYAISFATPSSWNYDFWDVYSDVECILQSLVFSPFFPSPLGKYGPFYENASLDRLILFLQSILPGEDDLECRLRSSP